MQDFNTIAEQLIFEQLLEDFALTGKIEDSWFDQSHEINNMTFVEAVQFLTNTQDA